jgi:hypothetical protein
MQAETADIVALEGHGSPGKAGKIRPLNARPSVRRKQVPVGRIEEHEDGFLCVLRSCDGGVGPMISVASASV